MNIRQFMYAAAAMLLVGCRSVVTGDEDLARPSTVDEILGDPTYHPMLLVPLPDLGELDVQGTPLEALVGHQTPIREVLMTLFRDSDINLMVDEDVTGQATFDFKNSTVEQAFEALLENLDLAYEFDGTFLRVRNLERASIVVDGLALGGQGAGAAGAGGNAGGNAGGTGGGQGQQGGQGGGEAGESALWAMLREDIESMVGDGGTAIVNATAGLIEIEARPSAVRNVRAYVETLVRRATRQVSLEARVLEVALDDEFRLGVNWNLLPGFFQSDETGLANGGGIVSQAASVGADQFQFGFLNGGDLSVFVDALETQGQVRVLTSPRVSAMNNQTANIRVVDNIPVIDREVIDSTGGLRTQFDIRFVEAGVTLAVTPQISDDGMITCAITPEVTEQVGTITTPDGLQIEPILATRTATTSVQVPDGRGIVIGGLRSTRKSENLSGVPLLMDLPILGALFRSTVQSRDEIELMVVLVPRVIDNSWRQEDIRRGAHRLVSLRRPFALGSIRLEDFRPEDWTNAALDGVPDSVDASVSEVRFTGDRDVAPEQSMTVTRGGLASRLIRRGRQRLAAGDVSEALRRFQSGLALAPSQVPLLVTTGVLLSRQGDGVMGRRYLDRALRIAGEDPVVLSARGSIDIRAGQPRAALRYLQQAHEKANAAWSASNLAGCMLQLGEVEQAQRLLASYASDTVEIPELFANLAFASLETDDLDAAHKWLNRSMELGADPSNPRVHALVRLVQRAEERAAAAAKTAEAEPAGVDGGAEEDVIR